MQHKERTAAVVTVSDSASSGHREDTSGDLLQSLLVQAGFRVSYREVVPDERQLIRSVLERLCSMRDVDIVMTTGGTGIGPRDVTPEATLEIVERQLPGMAEAMRMESIKKTPFAMTSRQVVGVCQTTLVINLPGSPKAVQECFEVVQPVLNHVVDLLNGRTQHKSNTKSTQ